MGTHPIFESDFDCLTEMSDIGWRESIENCRTWNAQMSHKRRARLPFHDASTDTYQNKCNLYINMDSKRRRGSGTCVFYYPPRRWQKQGQKGQMLDDPIMELKLMEDSYQQEMNSRAFSMSQTVDLYATLEGEIGPESDEEYQGPGRKRNRKGRASKGIASSSRKTRKSR